MASIQMCYFPFTRIKNELLAMTVSTVQPHSQYPSLIPIHRANPVANPTARLPKALCGASGHQALRDGAEGARPAHVHCLVSLMHGHPVLKSDLFLGIQ